jgi:O-antigen ligase
VTTAVEQIPGVLRPPFKWQPDPSSAGQLTWIATGVMAAALAAAAVFSGTAAGFVAVPLVMLVLIVFVVRPLIGFAIILVARPTLDLWANTQIVPVTHGHPINASTLMAGLVLVVGGAYVIERWSDVRQAPVIKPMIAFGLLALVSTPFSLGIGFGLTEVLRYSAIVVMYAIAFTLVRNRKSAAVIGGAVLASGIVPICYSLGQTFGNSLSKGHSGFYRAPGTLLAVDGMSILMALLITFGAAIALSRSTRWRWLLWIAAPFAFIALINSYGRTGWIGCVLGLVVLASSRYKWMLAVIPILLVAAAVVVPNTTARFQSVSTVGNSSGPSNTLSQRIGMWREALPHLQSRPVIGFGFGSDQIATGKLQVANDYVRALVEVGIPGIIAYLWILVGGLIAAYWGMELARFGTDRLMKALTLGAFAIFPVFLLVSGTANMMTQVVLTGEFWAMAAIGHAYLKRDWDGLRA